MHNVGLYDEEMCNVVRYMRKKRNKLLKVVGLHCTVKVKQLTHIWIHYKC